MRLQHEKGLAEARQGEHHANGYDDPKGRREAQEIFLVEWPAWPRCSLDAIWLSDAHNDQEHRKCSRHHCPPEHGAEIIRIERHQRHRQQRSRKPTHGIERLPDAVAGAADRGRRNVCHKRIARRIADALAYAIDETRGQNFPSRARERKHRLGDGGQSVTDADQKLALADAVGKGTRENLGDGGGSLGDALDQANHRHAGTDHRHEKHGEQAMNELGGDVHQQGNKTKRPNAFWYVAPRRGRHFCGFGAHISA